MNQKGIRILSIIALIFMAVFSVALILFFIDFDMGNGFVAGLAMVSGISGISLYFLVKYLKREKKDVFTPPDEDLADKDCDEAEVVEAEVLAEENTDKKNH